MKFIMVIALLTGCVTYDDHELRCEHQRLEDALHEVRWRVMSGLAKGDVEHLVGLRKKNRELACITAKVLGTLCCAEK